MNHNKADGFERRLEVGLFISRLTETEDSMCVNRSSTSWRISNIPLRSRGKRVIMHRKRSIGYSCTSFRSYVYYTQIMQAETLASAYRLWRRNWAGKGREYTAGALVWQVCQVTRPFRRPSFTPLHRSMTAGRRHRGPLSTTSCVRSRRTSPLSASCVPTRSA